MVGRPWTPLLAALLGLAALAPCSRGDTPDNSQVQTAIKKIKAVASQGKGNEEAAKAWKTLVNLGSPALLPTLAAMDNNAVTDNWLRPAVDAIADRIQQDGKKLPVKELEAFIQQRRNNPAARRSGFCLLSCSRSWSVYW